MKQPFEEGHTPREAYHRSPRTEPTGWLPSLGSGVLSSSVGKYLTEKAKRLICGWPPHDHTYALTPGGVV
jgi:hypothetical protein